MAYNKLEYLELIKLAERQYKFSVAVGSLALFNDEEIQNHLPTSMVWGSHSYTGVEFELKNEEMKECSVLMQNSAMYILVVQIDKFLEIFCKDRYKHSEHGIKNASILIRQIRNSFAHDPIYPKWDVKQPEAKGKRIEIPNIMEIDFSLVDGKIISRYDFGGPLAILRLSEYIRNRF